MFSPTDHRHMQRAIDLAERGRFATHPNPRVGCVVARGERVLGEGWHRKAGEAHAEVLALQTAGEGARGATAYVTLEPHCFQGKTPPCTDALIRSGVVRVVCGVLDPNPKVHGQGLRQLADAGIVAEQGLLAEAARELNLGFEKRMRTGLPRIVVKVAASIDGRIALANGESRWITSESARADVQRLRASASAVLTGIDTVLQDDPRLNVRDPTLDLAGRALLRVILDTRLRVRESAQLFSVPGPVLIATCAAASDRDRLLRQQGAELVRISPDSARGVDLREVLRELGRRECNDVLVEAGPTLTSRFLELGLCDELIVYLAPKFIGAQGKPMVYLPMLERLDDSLQFALRSAEPIGPDVKLTLRQT